MNAIVVFYAARGASDGATFISRTLKKAVKTLETAQGICFFEITEAEDGAAENYVQKNADGKPTLNEAAKRLFLCDGLNVSVTHNDDIIAAAFSYLPIGVDAERTDRRLSDGLIKKTGADSSDAIKHWTEIEALCKLSEVGVAELMDAQRFERCVCEYDVKFHYEIIGGDLITVAYI